MKLNETDLTNIRVRLVVRDLSGQLVDDIGVLAAGELQTSATGAAFVNAAGTLQRTGGGLYYYQGTLADAQTEGYLLVKVSKAGYNVEMNWAPVAGFSGVIRFPLTVYTDANALATGIIPTDAGWAMSVKGALWTAPTGTIREIGAGAYDYTHDVLNVGAFIGIKFSKVGYQDAIAWGSLDTIVTGADATPPVITILSPPPGATIGPSTAIKFRYTDNVGIRRAMPAIKFIGPNGYYHYEIVHDGDNFTPDYSGVRTIISGGFEFEVYRKNGWGATLSHVGGAPILVPFGSDVSGNEPS